MDDPPQTNPESLLYARAVNKTLADRNILRDVDVHLETGRILTLIGPNGAGKTTLVRVLLGLLPADSGIVRRRPGLRIGYMPQRVTPAAALPVSVHRFLRLARPADAGDIARRLEQLQIRHLAEQQLSSISGGELQRVLLARALLRDPHLLILDEPTQGVDAAGQAELYQMIGAIRREQGCGVLLVSHDLHLVMSATDEVICLNHHVCCHGKPEQVSTDPAFLELFGAGVAGNLAVYTHHHNHEHDIAGAVKVAGQESSQDPG